MAFLGVVVPDVLHDRVKALARRRGVPVAVVVREWLAEALDAEAPKAESK